MRRAVCQFRTWGQMNWLSSTPDMGCSRIVLSLLSMARKLEKRFQAARAYALKVRPVGTPAIVVDGRYMVTGHDFDDTLRITDYLVSRERAASHGR